MRKCLPIPRRAFPLLWAILATAPLAHGFDFRPYEITDEVSATSGSFNSVFDHYTFPNPVLWDIAGRTTTLSVNAGHDAFDPPANEASAFSSYTDPDNGLATYRSRSFALSQYSGVGSHAAYHASTVFRSSQIFRLEFTTAQLNSMYDVHLAVPTHGLLTARGDFDPTTSSIARASLALSCSGNRIDSFVDGNISVASNGVDPLTVQTGGVWAGQASAANVAVPSATGSFTADGYELSNLTFLDLGELDPETANSINFQLNFSLLTSVDTDSASGVFALADFSATAGFEFQLFDQAGNAFHDFIVTAVAVPEPSLSLLLPLILVARRRWRTMGLTPSACL